MSRVAAVSCRCRKNDPKIGEFFSHGYAWLLFELCTRVATAATVVVAAGSYWTLIASTHFVRVISSEARNAVIFAFVCRRSARQWSAAVPTPVPQSSRAR